MKITPITDPGTLHKGLEVVPRERQALVNEAIRREEPEILSFLPGVDTTRVAFNNVELCTYILHYNFRQLLRLPSLGIIDQKQKYSSIYNNVGSLQQFMSTQGVKMLSYRVVAEIMLLYGLHAADMKTISTWCCTFQPDGSGKEPDYAKLTSIYTKKQLAQHIKDHVDEAATKMFPIRILKGMEYLSYADFLHVFQSVGQDPYQLLEKFVKREDNTLPKYGIAGIKEDAFVLDYLDGPPAKPVCKPAEEPAPNLIVAEDTELSATLAKPSKDEEMANQFAQVVNDAVRPMSRRRKVNLAANILNLRKGVSDSNTIGFDSLFLASGCTNLDIFNYAARVSVSYRVPMYDLFYHDIGPGEFEPKQSFTVPEYTLDDISDVVNQGKTVRIQVTDENMFELLADRPPMYLRQFGELRGEASKQPVAAQKSVVNPPCATQEPIVADNTGIKEKERITMNIKLRLRVCTPCDADSWENDNPDRSAPGFHWDNASQEITEKAQACVEAKLNSGLIDLDQVKAELSKLIEHPYKAQVQAVGEGCRMTLELF